MSEKQTCGVFYREAFLKYGEGNTALERAFAAGFVSGQAEKVHLGACTAAMFRPSEEKRPLIQAILDDVLPRYGLVAQWIGDEVWISRSESCQRVRGMLDFVVNSEFWHRIRGKLCGVPHEELDLMFHERRGYKERCD